MEKIRRPKGSSITSAINTSFESHVGSTNAPESTENDQFNKRRKERGEVLSWSWEFLGVVPIPDETQNKVAISTQES